MDIMSLLGQTTLQMTSRYTHAMPQNLRTAVDSLNKEPVAFRPKATSAKSAPSCDWNRCSLKGREEEEAVSC